MPRLPDDFLQELLARVDIVDLVSSQVRLTRKGRNFWGLCPFHNEKTPSFSVSPDKQIFYCFGCHEGGGPIQFLQKTRRMEFMEAVQELCDRTGMTMPETSSGDEGARDLRQQMFAANQDAARFFHRMLMSEPGKVGLDYLTRRGVGKKSIIPFGLGFAPDAWDALSRELGKKYSREVLVKASLLRQKDSRVYDAFRNRVMFPILNARKQVVAFGGRVMDGSEPKYLNSPETPVFSKSRNLYGLHLLPELKHIDTLLVTEGYMDVISVRSTGFLPVVASLGTALTTQQAAIIKRYTDTVCLCYDGDSAGQNAAWRGMGILKDAGLKVRVATLPAPMDPDDYARKYGKEGIDDLVEKALPMTEFQFQSLMKQADLTNPEGRLAYANAICRQVLSSMKSPLELSEYVHRLYTETGIREEDIRRELENLATAAAREPGYTSGLQLAPQQEKPEASESAQSRKLRVAERTVLALWVRGKISRQSMEHAGMDAEFFGDEAHRLLYAFLTEHEADVWNKPFSTYAHLLPQGAAGLVAGFLEEENYARISQEYLADCMTTVKLGALQRLYQQRLLSLASMSAQDRQQAMQEMKQLQERMHRLQEKPGTGRSPE